MLVAQSQGHGIRYGVGQGRPVREDSHSQSGWLTMGCPSCDTPAGCQLPTGWDTVNGKFPLANLEPFKKESDQDKNYHTDCAFSACVPYGDF